jgi:hypothetical protein
VFDKMFARKCFAKMERNLIGLDEYGSYDLKGALMGEFG